MCNLRFSLQDRKRCISFSPERHSAYHTCPGKRNEEKRLEPELQEALDANRLLIISPFGEEIKRVTKDTAFERNRTMLELADEILISYASKGGSLERLIDSAGGKRIAFMEG